VGDSVSLRRLPPSTRSWLRTTPRLLVGLTLAHLAVLALRIPLFTSLPGWFWHLRNKRPKPWPLFVGLALLPAAVLLAARRLGSHRPGWVLAGLVCCGTLLQHGLALVEGRGLDGMRDRIVHAGHAEFALVAVGQKSLLDVAAHYEEKIENGELGRYAHSKPPGTLLFYMLTERLARPLSTSSDPVDRLEGLRDLAALAWPAVSMLVLLPLYWLGRRFVGCEQALVACLLYIAVPAAQLITLHTDQVLFPVLLVSTVWLATVACAQDRPWLAALAGAVAYLAVFCSFQLLLALPMAIGASAAVAPAARRAARLRRCWLAFALGFAALFLGAAFVLDYDLVAGYRDARAYHREWKDWEPSLQATLGYALLGYLEFAVWLGVPLSVLALQRGWRAVRGALARSMTGLDLPMLVLLGVFLAVGFLGETKGETARLWLPLAPLCCLAACDRLELRPQKQDFDSLALVVALQWLTVLLTKVRQDFW